jgi:hypothetical protein
MRAVCCTGGVVIVITGLARAGGDENTLGHIRTGGMVARLVGGQGIRQQAGDDGEQE